MQLTAKYIDMESAEFTAVLHTEDAREIGVREQDRVRIKHERSSAVTVVQTTDTVVKKGDVGILGKAWSALGPDPDELIEVRFGRSSAISAPTTLVISNLPRISPRSTSTA
jgi:AMP phosphorylase